jgi:hypothetical protein
LGANWDLFAASADATASAAIFEHDLDCLPIAPILAGARARGVADAFEILGVAAILLGREGDVLYANDQARLLLAPHLRIVGERLTATDKANERALARLIETAVAGRQAEARSVVLRRGETVPALRLHATPIADDDPFQLLRAVIVLDRKA